MSAVKLYIDQYGRIYHGSRDVQRQHGVSRSQFIRQMKDKGEYTNVEKGLIITPYREGAAAPDTTPSDKYASVIKKLTEVYSPAELEILARGGSPTNKRLTYPEIHIHGAHHKYLVISDTHIGSIYSPTEWHDVAARVADERNVDAVLHCGDLVDGLKRGRDGQIYELDAIGYKAQLAKAVEVFGKYNKPVYIIAGNHDGYFMESAGADIVKAFADALPNVTYIGSNSGDLDIDGCTVRLFHGGDGSSYSVSYRLQKLCELYENGKKPDVLLAGHVHKYCTIYDRGIHAVSVPAMQMQSKYMEAKRLLAHTGILVVEFDTFDHKVRNFKVEYIPFYA